MVQPEIVCGEPPPPSSLHPPGKDHREEVWKCKMRRACLSPPPSLVCVIPSPCGAQLLDSCCQVILPQARRTLHSILIYPQRSAASPRHAPFSSPTHSYQTCDLFTFTVTCDSFVHILPTFGLSSPFPALLPE